MLLYEDALETPVGRCFFLMDARGSVRLLDWENHRAQALPALAKAYRCSQDSFSIVRGENAFGVRAALAAYFDADTPDGAALGVIPVTLPPHATPFFTQVWHALMRIPLGELVTYGALAAACGRPRGARAVGRAVGSNPISILVPCHRVIGSSQAMTGYGGGLHRKVWLLRHERANTSESHMAAAEHVQGRSLKRRRSSERLSGSATPPPTPVEPPAARSQS